MTWWNLAISALGAAAQNNAANNASQDMTDAQTNASQQQIDLARSIYGDQRGLMMPDYLRGQDAANIYAALYGIAPQTYTGSNAFSMSPGYAGSNGGYGADGSLPTPLSTGNGGLPSVSQMITGGNDPSLYNAISNGNISNPDWWATGGPSLSGQAMASVLGIRGRGNGGSAVDQWGTPQQNAADAGKYDYAGYIDSDPGLTNWFNNLSDRDQRYITTAYDVDGDGRVSKAEAGQMHYEVHGQKEGRAINPLASGAGTGTAGTGAGSGSAGTASTPGSTAPALDPMGMFQNSVDYKLAQNQFLNFDVPEIQSAFATQGKALSGAQQKALADRGTRNTSNAFADYKNSLGALAGYGQVAGSNVASAAGQFGAAAGNAYGNIGTANANNAANRYQNQTNAFNSIGRAYGSQSDGWV